MRPGGVIFVGDVRNLRLLEAFHREVLHCTASSQVDLLERLAREEELVLDPAWFLEWAGDRFDARVLIKRGKG